MADEDQEPVVEEPVTNVGVAKVEEPRRTNKAVIGWLSVWLSVCDHYLCRVFRQEEGARNNTLQPIQIPMLNSRTISNNSGYGGIFIIIALKILMYKKIILF